MAGYEFNDDYYLSTTDEPVLYGIQYTLGALASEPVDATFFKQHARIDFATDDTLVSAYLVAAREYLERYAQLSFGVRTVTLTALKLPKNYRLMYGKVNTVTTSGYTNVGDILKEGGTDLTVQYTTTGYTSDLVKVAICRYAAGLYINRENVIETKFAAGQLYDEAKKMLRPIMNITFL